MDELGVRLRRLEGSINDIPSLQLSTVRDGRVPAVIQIIAASTSIAAKLTRARISWISPTDPTISHYEVWIGNIANGSKQPALVASVKNSPASFNVVSDGAGTGLAYVLTVMKNGLKTDLKDAPTVKVTVF